MKQKHWDTSSSKGLGHTLLLPSCQVKLCPNPQVTAEQLQALNNNKVTAAQDFEQRLQAHQKIQRITEEQPLLSGPEERKMTAATLMQRQKRQVRAALSKGHFTVNSETDAEYQDFLKELNPSYEPPNKYEIVQFREELHKERLECRDGMVRRMGPWLS